MQSTQRRTPTIDIGRLFMAKSLSMDSFTQLMQRARALPAQAGSILAWDCEVIHSGGVARRPTKPRISVSAKFVYAADRSGDDGSLLSIAARSVPSFSDRLRVIARCIGLFGANDARTFRYQDLGRMLANAVDDDYSRVG
jgi:hypothetical protein